MRCIFASAQEFSELSLELSTSIIQAVAAGLTGGTAQTVVRLLIPRWGCAAVIYFDQPVQNFENPDFSLTSLITRWYSAIIS